jgi:hypothetical protein
LNNKLILLAYITIAIFASCKKTSPANDPPEPIKSIVLPSLDMDLVSPCYALPDNSLVLMGGYINSNNLHLLKFDKDLNLIDSAVLNNVSLDVFDNIVRGDKFYVKTYNGFFEINSNLETVQINPKIEKDMGFDNSAGIHAMACCIGPGETILFAANGHVGGVKKFVLAAYGQDITKPLWVVDTLPMGGGTDVVTNIGYFDNKLFVWGSQSINTSSTKNYTKIYQWGGTLLYEKLLETQFIRGHNCRVLDSSLVIQPGICYWLNDNTIKFTGIYADQIFPNPLNGYTVFYSSEGNRSGGGYICNLSKDFLIQKKHTLPNVPVPYTQVFGPAGPDTWIFASSFHDDNNIMKIRLTKLNKNLE